MPSRAFITPKVLKWARESARMSLETAANKLSILPDKLDEWENGKSQPTIIQAQKLSKAYKRPFAVLFLPDIPSDFLPLQDFRKHNSAELSTGSLFMIREIQSKQAWISEINQESGEEPLPFVGRFDLNANPNDVAQDILNTLNINPERYVSENPIIEWVEKAEAHGIFISRTSFIHSRLILDSTELKGFAIADIYAPFIFINTDDWLAPQLFTLVHELAHIWIASSGISNEIDINVMPNTNTHPIELFCNQVAASALIPTSLILNLDYSNYNASIFKAAKKLGVSTLSVINRAHNLNIINSHNYQKLKDIAQVEFDAYIAKEEAKIHSQKNNTSGGPNYYRLALNKNSKVFTQIVLSYFRGGVIPPTLASSLLNITVNKFPKLESFINQ